RCLRDFGCAAALLSVCCCRAQADFSLPGKISAHSVSGQFIVSGADGISALAASPAIATNADFVRLEPALLAVSAERIKQSLWRELKINPNSPWRGRIFLALHPARSLDEGVTIISTPSIGGWSYQALLPDVLPRARFARALVSVLLLEFANRDARAHSAEIPDWLADGLSQQLLAENSSEIILSSPDKIINGLEQTRLVRVEKGIDPLANARRVLRNDSALTFEQLSWPTGAQLKGADGGVYRASAQLFVGELLGLKNGPAHLRVMLQKLPQFYNWQTAFQKAFRAEFRRPLDVEKWWALQVVNFAAHDPGPQWTPAVSRGKLDQILSVPVDMRAASNALPAHAEISLQAVIRNFNSARQPEILQIKLRDLGLAQLRMAPQLAVLTDAYRRVLAAYLGENNHAVSSPRWQKNAESRKTGAPETLKKLDALDARRRTIETAIKPDFFTPRNLNAPVP
ncbi:MAG: hypothetical protein ACREC8_12635, partial [Limisphaerales bacterium]